MKQIQKSSVKINLFTGIYIQGEGGLWIRPLWRIMRSYDFQVEFSPPPSVWKIVKPRGQISVYRIIDVQMFKIVVLFGLGVKQLNVNKYKIFLWRRKKKSAKPKLFWNFNSVPWLTWKLNATTSISSLFHAVLFRKHIIVLYHN